MRVVYLFLHNRFFDTLPERANHVLMKSFDGGKHWTQPKVIMRTVDTCYHVDPIIGRCVEDGCAGARVDLSAAPSVDIANGAPSGTDATNAIVDSWADGSRGLNNEKAMLMWSTDRGATWSNPTVVSNPGDRPLYAAPAISPDGSRVYVIYEGVTSPWRGANMTAPRPYHGVFRAADMGANVWRRLGPGSMEPARESRRPLDLGPRYDYLARGDTHASPFSSFEGMKTWRYFGSNTSVSGRIACSGGNAAMPLSPSSGRAPRASATTTKGKTAWKLRVGPPAKGTSIQASEKAAVLAEVALPAEKGEPLYVAPNSREWVPHVLESRFSCGLWRVTLGADEGAASRVLDALVKIGSIETGLDIRVQTF